MESKKKHNGTNAKLKSELAVEYGVSMTTMRKWINAIPNLNLSKNQRLLTPVQVDIIYAHLGSPEIA